MKKLTKTQKKKLVAGVLGGGALLGLGIYIGRKTDPLSLNNLGAIAAYRKGDKTEGGLAFFRNLQSEKPVYKWAITPNYLKGLGEDISRFAKEVAEHE